MVDITGWDEYNDSVSSSYAVTATSNLNANEEIKIALLELIALIDRLSQEIVK